MASLTHPLQLLVSQRSRRQRNFRVGSRWCFPPWFFSLNSNSGCLAWVFCRKSENRGEAAWGFAFVHFVANKRTVSQSADRTLVFRVHQSTNFTQHLIPYYRDTLVFRRRRNFSFSRFRERNFSFTNHGNPGTETTSKFKQEGKIPLVGPRPYSALQGCKRSWSRFEKGERS